MKDDLKLTKEQAAFYKDIDAKAAAGDGLYPQFEHNGVVVRVHPHNTCMGDVFVVADNKVTADHPLAVRNIPGTKGLHAGEVLVKVVAAAKEQYKPVAEPQHFVLYWARTVRDWGVTTASDAYVNLEACSPEGGMHMVLTAFNDSTEVHIHLPKGMAGIQLTVDAPLQRDPIGLSRIVRKALTSLAQDNFTRA